MLRFKRRLLLDKAGRYIFYVVAKEETAFKFRQYFSSYKQALVDNLLYRLQSRFNVARAAYNSVFIKLWRDVKHSTLNHYFAFVVN